MLFVSTAGDGNPLSEVQLVLAESCTRDGRWRAAIKLPGTDVRPMKKPLTKEDRLTLQSFAQADGFSVVLPSPPGSERRKVGGTRSDWARFAEKSRTGPPPLTRESRLQADRHRESVAATVRAGQQVQSADRCLDNDERTRNVEFLNWLENSGFSTWIKESNSLWAYDLYLTLHAIGMAAIVGLSAAVALRVLGFASRLPLAPMEKFFPLMYAGFWVNAGSGLVLFVAYPVKAVTNLGFFIKMSGVVLAVLCLRRLRRQVFGNPATLDRGPVPKNGKILAGTLLFLWWGTILTGRLMAYHGIANVEWEASLAVFVVTGVLLAGFITARFLGGSARLPQRTGEAAPHWSGGPRRGV